MEDERGRERGGGAAARVRAGAGELGETGPERALGGVVPGRDRGGGRAGARSRGVLVALSRSARWGLVVAGLDRPPRRRARLAGIGPALVAAGRVGAVRSAGAWGEPRGAGPALGRGAGRRPSGERGSALVAGSSRTEAGAAAASARTGVGESSAGAAAPGLEPGRRSPGRGPPRPGPRHEGQPAPPRGRIWSVPPGAARPVPRGPLSGRPAPAPTCSSGPAGAARRGSSARRPCSAADTWPCWPNRWTVPILSTRSGWTSRRPLAWSPPRRERPLSTSGPWRTSGRMSSPSACLAPGQKGLAAGPGQLVLTQPTPARRAWVPLLFCWDRDRNRRGAFWRTLTVTERSRICGPEVAVAFRVGWGLSDSLVLYRSLARPATRAFLGCQTSARFLIGLFSRAGKLTPLVSIE